MRTMLLSLLLTTFLATVVSGGALKMCNDELKGLDFSSVGRSPAARFWSSKAGASVGEKEEQR